MTRVLDPATGVLTAQAWAARVHAVLRGHLAPDVAGWAVLTVDVTRAAPASAGEPRSLDATVLAAAARALMATTGPRALVTRLDGTAFVVLTGTGEPTTTHLVVEALARAVGALRDRAGAPLGVTASVGAALLPARPRPAQLAAAFWAADSALHDAQHAGGRIR